MMNHEKVLSLRETTRLAELEKRLEDLETRLKEER